VARAHIQTRDPRSDNADQAGFRVLPDAVGPPAALAGQRGPAVLRSVAAHWPAIRRWTFPYLASLDPDHVVELVVGNREHDDTRIEVGTLGSYLQSLAEPPQPGAEQRYLKELDLLGRFPRLSDDLRQRELFPSGSVMSSSAWIGPTGARTGLHYDLLDNVAVQIVGRKRFYLARPGTVERAGAVSGKYDQWAQLSTVGVSELAAGRAASGDFFVVDLEPGDVLRVPATWWHEVVNLSPSVLLSGFFGPRAEVGALWLRTTGRHAAHRLGWVGRAGCTCHAAGAAGASR
jgi:hypothetical protein